MEFKVVIRLFNKLNQSQPTSKCKQNIFSYFLSSRSNSLGYHEYRRDDMKSEPQKPKCDSPEFYETKFKESRKKLKNEWLNRYTITPVNWDTTQLEPIKKNLYTEPDVIKNRCSEEVTEFREKNDVFIESPFQDIKPILRFSDYSFSPPLQQALDYMKFKDPLPIQSVTWPLLLSGLDVIGIGKTGCGKTLAFALPAVFHGLSQEQKSGPCVVVLVPTTELALQTQSVFRSVSKLANVSIACIHGGSTRLAIRIELQTNPMVIVGTPGRLIDLISDKTINIQTCSCFIIDEADVMLTLGLEPQLSMIETQIRPDRQTLMWSATWPKEVKNLASSFISNPVLINVGTSDLRVNKDVMQELVFCKPKERNEKFKEVIEAEYKRKPKILVFVNRKRDIEKISAIMVEVGYDSRELHGGMSKDRRGIVMNAFRRGATMAVIATDIAARGLDVPNIDVVVNYDLPGTLEKYIHRIGRTGRAGNKGRSVTLCSKDKSFMAKKLFQMFKRNEIPIPKELKEMNNFL